VPILRTSNTQIGVQPAVIDVQFDSQIAACSELACGELVGSVEGPGKGEKVVEGGRQDKRIVSAVSVFAADSGTCSADMVTEGHTNIGWQVKRNQGALFVSPFPAMTWSNL
jgi:hypothetical protein